MSCQLWWEWWHPRRSLFQSCIKNNLHDLIDYKTHRTSYPRRSFLCLCYCCSPGHLKLWVLANDLGSEEARLIVPLDPISVPGGRRSCHVKIVWSRTSYSWSVIVLTKHLPTCCWGLRDKPHRRTPEGRRLWVRSGPSRSRACRPSDLRSCPAVSCPPGQSCWEWSTMRDVILRIQVESFSSEGSHLLQNVSLLGILVGGIRLFPSAQNLEHQVSVSKTITASMKYFSLVEY